VDKLIFVAFCFARKGVEGSAQPGGPTGQGLGLGAKLFYAAVIMAACVAFVKTRKGRTAAHR